MADVALVGGTFDETEGHNPWEPARLGAAILHGPRTANFAHDFAALDQAASKPIFDEAARLIEEHRPKEMPSWFSDRIDALMSPCNGATPPVELPKKTPQSLSASGTRSAVASDAPATEASKVGRRTGMPS